MAYWTRPQAGPEGTTSLTTTAGSPDVKCGLSRPPETAIPNPTVGTCKRFPLMAELKGSYNNIMNNTAMITKQISIITQKN